MCSSKTIDALPDVAYAPSPVPRRLSPELVRVVARMVEAKLAAAGSPPVAPAPPPARNEGMVGRRAGGTAGGQGG
jgi:hypothetical protein